MSVLLRVLSKLLSSFLGRIVVRFLPSLLAIKQYFLVNFQWLRMFFSSQFGWAFLILLRKIGWMVYFLFTHPWAFIITMLGSSMVTDIFDRLFELVATSTVRLTMHVVKTVLNPFMTQQLNNAGVGSGASINVIRDAFSFLPPAMVDIMCYCGIVTAWGQIITVLTTGVTLSIVIPRIMKH